MTCSFFAHLVVQNAYNAPGGPPARATADEKAATGESAVAWKLDRHQLAYSGNWSGYAGSCGMSAQTLLSLVTRRRDHRFQQKLAKI